MIFLVFVLCTVFCRDFFIIREYANHFCTAGYQEVNEMIVPAGVCVSTATLLGSISIASSCSSVKWTSYSYTCHQTGTTFNVSECTRLYPYPFNHYISCHKASDSEINRQYLNITRKDYYDQRGYALIKPPSSTCQQVFGAFSMKGSGSCTNQELWLYNYCSGLSVFSGSITTSSSSWTQLLIYTGLIYKARCISDVKSAYDPVALDPLPTDNIGGILGGTFGGLFGLAAILCCLIPLVLICLLVLVCGCCVCCFLGILAASGVIGGGAVGGGYFARPHLTEFYLTGGSSSVVKVDVVSGSGSQSSEDSVHSSAVKDSSTKSSSSSSSSSSAEEQLTEELEKVTKPDKIDEDKPKSVVYSTNVEERIGLNRRMTLLDARNLAKKRGLVIVKNARNEQYYFCKEKRGKVTVLTRLKLK